MATWLQYAGLTRQAFPNPTSIAWKRQPAIIVLHSTEGDGYPSATTYRQGRSAPHFTIDVRGRTCRQHYPLTVGAWALQAPAGVATNSGGAIQIEIIGTCAGAAGVQSVLTFTDADLAYLAGLLRTIAAATGIPLVTSARWVAYPASYGNKQGQRLLPGQWASYRGVLGHQHVPGNTHGDPGNFPITRLLQIAGGVPEEDIMATRRELQEDLAQSRNEIVKAVTDAINGARRGRQEDLAQNRNEVLAAVPAAVWETDQGRQALVLLTGLHERDAGAVAGAIPDEIVTEVLRLLRERLSVAEQTRG